MQDRRSGRLLRPANDVIEAPPSSRFERANHPSILVVDTTRPAERSQSFPMIPNELPAVSVVMIFRDAARFMEEAIQSVLRQTFSDFELLLCDDGSRDA